MAAKRPVKKPVGDYAVALAAMAALRNTHGR